MVIIKRELAIPDPLRIARCRAYPALGPHLLFFSGGTSLKRVSKHLVDYTHHSIHLITSFDSGGSSAEIRRAFRMISVGDLRNRLMALADQSIEGHPEIYRLFSFRLPKSENQEELRKILESMIQDEHELVQKIRRPMKTLIINHLLFFRQGMPADFDLRGASIGNLILAGGYLEQEMDLDSVIFMFSKLVGVKGEVHPITHENFHLGCLLENGEKIVGQHLMTGKETGHLKNKIKSIFLCSDQKGEQIVRPKASEKIIHLIKKSECLIYPFGSFYSSLLANLLLQGVGSAIAEKKVPKVFFLNPEGDPEQVGMGATESVMILLETLAADNAVFQDRLKQGDQDFIDFVFYDQRASYHGQIDHELLNQHGIQCISVDILSGENSSYYDPEKVCELLCSLM